MPRTSYKTKRKFKQAFLGRVRAAREATGLTQMQMAAMLGVDVGTYGKWETRTLMPHEFVDLFCEAAGVTHHWLYRGEKALPVWVVGAALRKQG